MFQLVPFEHYIPFNRNISDLLDKIQWAKDNESKVEYCKLNETCRCYLFNHLTQHYKYVSCPTDICLMGVFHWSQPYHRLYHSRVGCKSWGSGTKSQKKAHENFRLVSYPCQDLVHPGLSGSRSDLT